MVDRTIYITDSDKTRLEELLIVANEFSPSHLSPDLRKLAHEISIAEIVPSIEVPGDVVTMNSQVELVYSGSNETSVFTLAFPIDVKMETDYISVLSPVGTAILGCSEGARVEFDTPSGKSILKIGKILYQPEASGKPD